MLSQQEKEQLTTLLKENEGLFAWESGQVIGINKNLIEHKLNVDPNAYPVKQKLRPLRADKKQASNSEFEKLEKGGFIKEIKYPKRLSNIIMIRKAIGWWRMCIDYTNLHRACPKDSYPLPPIELVNKSVGCKLLRFMDAYSSYNHVPMCKEDKSMI